MNQPSDTRRDFVKKSFATSAAVSFAGLIRAHGEEGGGTSWNPEETTVATTSGGITTWNPDETTFDYWSTTWNPEETTATTETTTGNPLVSLQKQIPHDGDGPIFHNSLIHGPNVYLRIENLVSDFGLLDISAGPNPVFVAQPTWYVTLFQEVKADEDQTKWVPTDCASCRVRVKIELRLFPNNQFPPNIPAGLVEGLLQSIYGVMAPEIAADPGLMAGRTAPGISIAFIDGPTLTAGYNVQAAYGIDHGVPNQIGPLVIVGNRLGRVDTSSRGYWLTLDSQLSPTPPSRSVNFKWSTMLRRSKFIIVEEHVRAAILNGLNGGLIQQIQAQHPGNAVTVQCHIPELPTRNAWISQVVVACDLPPNAAGTDCPLMYPGECEGGSGPTPPTERPPDDDHWDQDDPDDVPCPPPPIIV